MASDQSRCIICEYEISNEDLAAHFGSCFERHCPVMSATRGAPSVVPTRTLGQLPLGGMNLPSNVRELALENLSPPEYLHLATLSKGFHEIMQCNHYHWHICFDRLWNRIRSMCFLSTSSNDCECRFDTPAMEGNYFPEIVSRLWRAMTHDRVYVHVKTMTGKWLDFVLDENQGNGVLLSTSVAHLKEVVYEKEGVPPSQCVLVSPGGRVLKHESAPLAIYVWETVQQARSDSALSIYLNVVLRMSIGNCTSAAPSSMSLDFSHISITRTLPDRGWRIYQDFSGRPWFWLSKTEWFYEDEATMNGWWQFRGTGELWWWHERTGRWFFDPRFASRVV